MSILHTSIFLLH
uniref:Uncharacterized protein n=1 Tax=Arundo donax TaxID=35708 RepID=A0A0A9GR95_ARUDO